MNLNILSQLPARLPQRITPLTAASTAAAVLALYLYNPFGTAKTTSGIPNSTPSPRIDLPNLTEEQIAALPYPPDFYPGGSWLTTPYGVIRTFEFGPEDGIPLVFVHGISTPCCVARDVVHALANRGCRILIFDLFGRGWSDTPYLPHDERLAATQIAFVTAAAKADFSTFVLCGYSLGGGIAASFASYFPERVARLILIAPAGLLKTSKLGLAARLAQSGYIPRLIEKVALKLRMKKRHPADEGGIITETGEPLGGEGALPPAAVDIASVVHWQSTSHHGFFYSFASSFHYGPIYDREEEWTRLGKILAEGKIGGQALFIMGENDDVIPMSTLHEGVAILGEKQVRGRVVKDVGHDLVATKPKDVVAEIVEFLHL